MRRVLAQQLRIYDQFHEAPAIVVEIGRDQVGESRIGEQAGANPPGEFECLAEKSLQRRVTRHGTEQGRKESRCICQRLVICEACRRKIASVRFKRTQLDPQLERGHAPGLRGLERPSEHRTRAGAIRPHAHLPSNSRQRTRVFRVRGKYVVVSRARDLMLTAMRRRARTSPPPFHGYRARATQARGLPTPRRSWLLSLPPFRIAMARDARPRASRHEAACRSSRKSCTKTSGPPRASPTYSRRRPCGSKMKVPAEWSIV